MTTKPQTETDVPYTVQASDVGREDEGFFASMGAIGGVLLILIALAWFGFGYAAGYIYFYPPVLALVGLGIIIKDLGSSRA